MYLITSYVSKLIKITTKLVVYHAYTPPPPAKPLPKRNLVLDPPLVLFIGGPRIPGFPVGLVGRGADGWRGRQNEMG